MWPLARPFIRDLNINAWALPTLEQQRFTAIAKLFYELPWSSHRNVSIELVSDDAQQETDFMKATRRLKMCFNGVVNATNVTNVQVLLGENVAIEYDPNSTIVAIFLTENREDISLLPEGSYMIAEAELDLNAIKNVSAVSVTSLPTPPSATAQIKVSATQGTSVEHILPTDFIILGSMLLEITQWLNDSINSNCLRRHKHLGLGGCSTILLDTPQMSYAYLNAVGDLVRYLQVEHMLNSFKFELVQKKLVEEDEGAIVTELKPLASLSLVNNATAILRPVPKYRNGTIMPLFRLGPHLVCTVQNMTKEVPVDPMKGFEEEFYRSFWRVRTDGWVALGLTIAILGIVMCVAILLFFLSRICIQDVLEGNPTGSVLLLLALILQFGSFVPFSIEYTGYHQNSSTTTDTLSTMNTHCSVKIFLISLCYCLTFSLLLCRAVMLASIGSEGGFLSHVNGYIQSVICFFSTLVQLGLSTQVLVFMNTIKSISCNEIFYGHWFWGIVAYDGLLLVMLLCLAPLIVKSTRNYREGMFLILGGVLSIVVWCTWIPLALLGDNWREVAIPLGSLGTAFAILIGILVPRTFLIIRSIARADIVQALPSLTSLAFAQAANQYASEQVGNSFQHLLGGTATTVI